MGDAGSRGIHGSKDADPKRVYIEIFVLWLATNLLIRFALFAQKSAGLPEIVLAVVPILFMYAPVLVCNLRKVDSDLYPLALPAFRDRAWLDALKLDLQVIGVIVLPWLLAYHLWTTIVMGFAFEGTLPSSPLKVIAYHLFFVAVPEEMFYRGYIQSRLDEVLGKPWTVLGAQIGPGLIATCAIFAAGHSLVQVQWWHFAIFFPALLFGWMRARTGQILAGAGFHAWCNIAVNLLDTMYGVVAP